MNRPSLRSTLVGFASAPWHRPAVAALGFVAALLTAGGAHAVTVTRQGSGMEAMFASQSDVFRDSDPLAILWGAPPGFGPYPSGAIIPGLPLPPAPAIAPAPGNAFANGGYSSTFNDLGGTTSYTAAQITLDDVVAAVPGVTADVQVQFPVIRLEQGPTAPGYTYLQANFGSNYLFTANAGLGASVNPAIPLLVSGQTIGLTSYAQFEASIDYTWIPASVNSSGLITQTGPAQPLGALGYSWQVAGPGPFGLILSSTGSLLGVPAGDGILSLTGFSWVAGDPVDLTVTLVPEPSAAAGLATAGGLAWWAWRRRCTQAAAARR